MLLHLGGGFSVDSGRIVLLSDLKKPPAAATRALTERLEKQGRVRRLPGRAATLILCEEEGRLYGVYSPIGLRTLRERAASPLTRLDP